jgi:hypothetical protein
VNPTPQEHGHQAKIIVAVDKRGLRVIQHRPRIRRTNMNPQAARLEPSRRIARDQTLGKQKANLLSRRALEGQGHHV